MTEPIAALIEPEHGITVYPDTLITIDPGERYIGVAFWHANNLESVGPWECYMTLLYEDEHEIFFGNLVWWFKLHLIVEVVAEEYRLYPDKLQQQGYSEVLTVRRLGVIEWLTHLAGVPYSEQGASIKKATRRIMAAMGKKHVGKSIHEKDAELHGYYRINNRKKGPVGG